MRPCEAKVKSGKLREDMNDTGHSGHTTEDNPTSNTVDKI